MDEYNPFGDLFSSQEHGSQTPSILGGSAHSDQTTGVSTFESATTTPHKKAATPAAPSRTNKRQKSSRPNLFLLRRDEWDKDNAYDEDPPTCLHYSIEWKVVVNKKLTSKDTEPDVVLTPAAYWEECLRSCVERLLEQKLGWNHLARIEDINVVVSVNARSERDLTKRFEREIDWVMVEKQLIQWGDLFQDGKRLRVDIAFNYAERSAANDPRPSKRGRARASATQQMLRARDVEVHAERESSGDHVVWADVYRLMRCPGPPCPLGPYCWRDPVGKTHYKLYPYHLRALVRFVEDGQKLECQADVPETIQQELQVADRLRSEGKPSKTAPLPHGMTPITINNHFPESSERASSLPLQNDRACSVKRSPTLLTGAPLGIPGHLDSVVKEYSEWQKLFVQDASSQDQVDKACEVVLAKGLDLNQLHSDQEYGFLIEHGVNEGTARRFIGNISTWAKRYRYEQT